MNKNDMILGASGVLVASTLWGTTGVAATFAPDVSPLAIGAAAMGIGGVLQALIALPQIAYSKSQIISQWKLLLVGSLAIMIYPLAFYSSMRLAGVAVGTVVSIGFAPIASALIEYFFDKKKLSKRFKAGALLGITGATILCIAKADTQLNYSLSALNSDVAGILLGIVAATTYALYSWDAHRLMKLGIPARAAMGTLFGVGGVFLFPTLILTGKPFLYSWSNAAVGIYMAIIPMFFGYLCFGYGLARIPASMATTISLFEPAVAAILAVVIVGEILPVAAWNGIALIICSLFVLTMPSVDLKSTLRKVYNRV